MSSGHSPQGALGLNSVHLGFEPSFFQLLSLREPLEERIEPGFQVQICTPPMDVGSTPGFFSGPEPASPSARVLLSFAWLVPLESSLCLRVIWLAPSIPLCSVRKQIHLFGGLGHGQLWGHYSVNHTIPGSFLYPCYLCLNPQLGLYLRALAFSTPRL